MNDRLQLEYSVISHSTNFDQATGKTDIYLDTIRIQSEHTDHLEEIVRECLHCYRDVFITPHVPDHELNFLIRLYTQLDNHGDLPQFHDNLINYEQQVAECGLLPSLYLIEYKYSKLYDNYYEWRRYDQR